MSKNRRNPKYMKDEDGRKPLNKFLIIVGIGLGCCLLAVLGVLAVKAIFPPDASCFHHRQRRKNRGSPSSAIDDTSLAPVSS